MFFLKLKCPINVILVGLAYKSDLNKSFLVFNILQQVFKLVIVFCIVLNRSKNVSLLVEILSIYCNSLVDKLMLL